MFVALPYMAIRISVMQDQPSHSIYSSAISSTLGYKVRYVRNITDVGHLEHDADEGDDKIEKKARLEQLEPMEIAQYYTNRYHDAMEALNVLPPSIEPHATGHIIEQEKLVQEILDNGYAYESNGSIYFDIEKYNKDHKYGILSAVTWRTSSMKAVNLLVSARRKIRLISLSGRSASPEHIMRWPSPWSDGFPWLALRVYCDGQKVLRQPLRYSRRRYGLDFPSSRVRDCSGCGFSGRSDGSLLDA